MDMPTTDATKMIKMIGQCLRTARMIIAGEKVGSGSLCATGSVGNCDGFIKILLRESARHGDLRCAQFGFSGLTDRHEVATEGQERGGQLVDQDLQ